VALLDVGAGRGERLSHPGGAPVDADPLDRCHDTRHTRDMTTIPAKVRITLAPLTLTITHPVSHTVAGHTFHITTSRTWTLRGKHHG
jgi:hypothetical protein